MRPLCVALRLCTALSEVRGPADAVAVAAAAAFKEVAARQGAASTADLLPAKNAAKLLRLALGALGAALAPSEGPVGDAARSARAFVLDTPAHPRLRRLAPCLEPSISVTGSPRRWHTSA